MAVPLKILMLEDRPADAKLALHQLRQAGFEPIGERVDTETDYLAHLTPDLEVILSDYSMPQLSAPRALSLLQEKGYDIPFIMLTGTVSEEVAVESIKQGAADYLLKDRLGRLGEAVKRVLEEKKAREERRKMEMQLRLSEENYRLLVSNIPDVTWVSERNGKRVFVSPNATRVLGYTVEELCFEDACSRFDSIHPDDVEKIRTEYEGLFETGETYDVQYRQRTKKGDWIWLHERAITTYEKDGIRYAYGVTSDINERKLLESQLHQSQKMEAVGRLAGGVAHDFNNLLTVILGYSDIILSSLSAGDSLVKHAEQVKQAGERAAALTQQLLAFSRQQVLQPRILNLNSIVSGIEKMLRRLIGEDIELETISDMDLGRVKADHGQVEQILLNLAVNARDAMPNGGKLVIQTGNLILGENDIAGNIDAPPGSYVKLSVRDTGCGIDKETLLHIFEPFFTTKALGKGTGLGLSTVYGIVKQSGGYIVVSSELGKGTTFEVLLPRMTTAEEPDRPVAVRSNAPVGNETILLVEDDHMVRALAHHALQLSGYKVLSADKGGAALLCCLGHQGPIDLMITDVVMPEMSGPELAARLSPDRPEMKVLYMSGYADDTKIQHGLSNQDIEFLPKPFTPDDLAWKVRQVLDKGPLVTPSNGLKGFGNSDRLASR